MSESPKKIIAVEHLSLDGVFQAPGRPDEDEEGGFAFGGWSAKRNDPKMGEIIGGTMKGGWSMLAGRRSYQILHESWPVLQPDNPMTDALTKAQKYVATRNAKTELPWQNSTLLVGDAKETVADLKRKTDKTLIIFGSGDLVRTLMSAHLVDEFLLMIHPIVLGKGLVFFDRGTPATPLELVNQVTTKAGVNIATYRDPEAR